MADILRDSDRDGEVGETSVAFTLTKPVDLATLEAELSEAMNWRKDGGFVAEGDAAQASKKKPVTVWVMRDDVEPATLRSVVAKHERPERVASTSPLVDLRGKAEAGDDFTPEEMQQVLREFVLRTTA